jgi:uncharacterized protein
MPRPFKLRNVCWEPEAVSFKPCGIRRRCLEQVTLTLDELEALRLADLEELYQENAAERMNVSRQTFGNILSSAHRKVADFIINTKHLNIEGGSVQINGGNDAKTIKKPITTGGFHEDLHTRFVPKRTRITIV